MPCQRRFQQNAVCFSSTYNIASASAFYPSRPQKNQQNHPHFTRLKIRKSAFYRRPRPDGSGRLLVGPQHCTRFGEMQCFSSTYNIASASAFYPSRPQKNQQNHPHFTHLKIRRSANPHFTGGRLEYRPGA